MERIKFYSKYDLTSGTSINNIIKFTNNFTNEISEYKRLVHRESTKELHGRGETVYYRCRQM